MEIAGVNLITKPTVVAARTLMIVSALVIFKAMFFAGEEIHPLGIALSERAYSFGAQMFLAYLMVNLGLHWYSDYVSHNEWYESNKVYFDRKHLNQQDASFSANDLSTLDTATTRPVAIKEIFENNEKHKGFYEEREIKSLRNILDQQRNSFSKLTFWAKLQICGWYLALPLTMGFVASFSIHVNIGEWVWLDCVIDFIGGTKCPETPSPEACTCENGLANLHSK